LPTIITFPFGKKTYPNPSQKKNKIKNRAAPSDGGMVPAGYTQTFNNGVPVTYNGKPVFDDGTNFYVRSA
jgi:hypothetical protein